MSNITIGSVSYFTDLWDSSLEIAGHVSFLNRVLSFERYTLAFYSNWATITLSASQVVDHWLLFQCIGTLSFWLRLLRTFDMPQALEWTTRYIYYTTLIIFDWVCLIPQAASVMNIIIPGTAARFFMFPDTLEQLPGEEIARFFIQIFLPHADPSDVLRLATFFFAQACACYKLLRIAYKGYKLPFVFVEHTPSWIPLTTIGVVTLLVLCKLRTIVDRASDSRGRLLSVLPTWSRLLILSAFALVFILLLSLMFFCYVRVHYLLNLYAEYIYDPETFYVYNTMGMAKLVFFSLSNSIDLFLTAYKMIRRWRMGLPQL